MGGKKAGGPERDWEAARGCNVKDKDPIIFPRNKIWVLLRQQHSRTGDATETLLFIIIREELGRQQRY